MMYHKGRAHRATSCWPHPAPPELHGPWRSCHSVPPYKDPLVQIWGTSDCTVYHKYLLFHLHTTSVLVSAAQAACPFASCHRYLQPHTTIVTFCSLLDVTLSHTNKHASPSALLSICVQEYVSVYVLPRKHTRTHTPFLSLSFSLSLPPSLGLCPSLAMFIREHTHTPKDFPLFCLRSHKCTHASNV